MTQVTFTQFTATNRALSKVFSRRGTQIIKKPAAQMSRGTAVQKSMPFNEFKDFLSSLKSEQAIGFGVHDVEQYGAEVEISTKADARPESGVLARTKEYFQYAQKPGIMMLDHDPNRFGKSFSPDRLLEMLTEIVPGFAQASCIVRGSVSAGVHLKDESPREGMGFHLYLPVKNAADIPRAGKALFDRLWLQGYGFVALSTCGSSMIRGPVDAAVFSPERLDFAGKPVIANDGLSYSPPQATWQDGDALDTSMIHDLDPHETTELERLQTGAKALMKDHAAEVRSGWELEHRVSLEGRGVEPDDIEKIFAGVGDAHTDLYPDWPLVFSDGRKVTVAEVLQDPRNFDECSLADPLEGVSYGTSTAVFYSNTGGRPIIHSFAHGGRVFHLKRSYGFDADRYVFLKETGEYFDSEDRSMICEAVLNKLHLMTNPGGQKRPPKAATVFHIDQRSDERTVRGQYWQPTDPQKPVKHIISVDGAKYLNSWQGIKCESIPGDLSLWFQLIEHLVRDKDERECLLDWLGFILQFPHLKPCWQIIHLGQQRNGKDSLYRPLMMILGSTGASIDDMELKRPFNGWAAEKKLLIFNELWRPDDRGFINRMKTMAASTADDAVLIDPKYGGQIRQANVLGFIAMSNHRDPVSVDMEEGRYFCLESFVPPLAKEFYSRYYAWLDGGGHRQVYHHLMNRDLSRFNGKVLPWKTPAFLRLVDAGKPDYERKIQEFIDMGEGPFSQKLVEFSSVKRLLQANGYQCGDKGLARALVNAGFSLYRNNCRNINGTTKKAPNFWTRENPGKTARERYDFYFATTDPDGSLARIREIQDGVKANQIRS